jgi:hypothetical protein
VRDVKLPVTLGLAALVAASTVAHAGARPREVPDAMRDEIAKHSPQIRRCYQRALEDAPDLGRKLVVKFRVSGGRTRAVEVIAAESTIHHAGVESCVARVFKSIRFRGSDPAWYRSPIIFG